MNNREPKMNTNEPIRYETADDATRTAMLEKTFGKYADGLKNAEGKIDTKVLDMYNNADIDSGASNGTPAAEQVQAPEQVATPEQTAEQADQAATEAAQARQSQYQSDTEALQQRAAAEASAPEQADATTENDTTSIDQTDNSAYNRAGSYFQIAKMEGAGRIKSYFKYGSKRHQNNLANLRAPKAENESQASYDARLAKADKIKNRAMNFRVINAGLFTGAIAGGAFAGLHAAFDSDPSQIQSNGGGNHSGTTTADIDHTAATNEDARLSNGQGLATEQQFEATRHQQYLDTFTPDAHQNPAMWDGKDHPNSFGTALESRPEFDKNFPGETDKYWRMRDNGHQAALVFSEEKIPGAPLESNYATKQEYINAVNAFGEDLNRNEDKYSKIYEAWVDKSYNPAHPAKYEVVAIDFPFESGYMKDGDANIVAWDDNVTHGGTAVKKTAHDGTVTWTRLDCDNPIKPLPKPTYVAPQGGEVYYVTPQGGEDTHYYYETPPHGGDTPPPYVPPEGGDTPPTGPPPTNPPPVNPPPVIPPGLDAKIPKQDINVNDLLPDWAKMGTDRVGPGAEQTDADVTIPGVTYEQPAPAPEVTTPAPNTTPSTIDPNKIAPVQTGVNPNTGANAADPGEG